MNCEICFEPNGERLLDCNHLFCTSCLNSYVKFSLESTKKMPLLCPKEACTCPIYSTNFLEEDIKIKYESMMIMSDINDLCESLFCPNPVCSELMIIDSEAKSHPAFPICECVACGQLVCARCKSIAHHPNISCEDNTQDNNQKIKIADEYNWKLCPNCSIIIDRIDGCNFILCKCGMGFCYKCGVPYLNDTTTDTNNHGTPNCKCGLFDFENEENQVVENPVPMNPFDLKDRYRCHGIKRDGNRCNYSFKHDEMFCRIHINQRRHVNVNDDIIVID
jgi:hypothetical protein